MENIRLLILGTGGMARNHAEGFGQIPGVQIVGGVDTRPAQLDAFRADFGIPNGFTSLGDALAWGEFDAVTNVTPDAAHYVTTMPLLAAGSEVLWVCGAGFAEGLAPDEDTAQVLQMEMEHREDIT